MPETTIKDPVNLSLGDKISAYAGRKTRETHKNSIWVSVSPPNEHFRSEISFKILLQQLEGSELIIAPDGIGTKVALIDAALGHKNAARDLIAMTAGVRLCFQTCSMFRAWEMLTTLIPTSQSNPCLTDLLKLQMKWGLPASRAKPQNSVCAYPVRTQTQL